ncbi:MAG: 50S ribosomal protein L18e [Candidatus Verstraetearchaeota archaeon]|nr:50S ribosomal protein L18e [Candidatus Verstraetearchaeota archaeon]
MVKRTLPTNPKTRRLIRLLRRASRSNNVGVWRDLSDLLSVPTRKRISVNVSKIEKFAKEGEFIAVPGRVLGFGNLSKKIDVAALSFTPSAREKITAAGGRAISLEVLLNLNPRGRGVTILR